MAKEGFCVKPGIEAASGQGARDRKTGWTYAD